MFNIDLIKKNILKTFKDSIKFRRFLS